MENVEMNQSNQLLNLRKRGILQIESTSRVILWTVENYPSLLESEKIVCSETFRVPTMTNCLFYLSMSVCEEGTFTLNVVRFVKNRCFSATESKPVTVNLVVKDDSNQVLMTKDMVMTKDVSPAVEFDEPQKNNSSVRTRLEVQCTIVKSEFSIGFQLQNAAGRSNKSKDYVPTISINELKDHLQVILEGNEGDRVTIFVDEQEFQAHKSILCSNSPVFAAMFEHETQEKATNQIHVEDIRAETIGEMLSFMYFGSTSQMTHEMAMAVYCAADKYSMINLRRKCSNYLTTHMEKDFVLEILVMADRHADDELTKAAVRFLVDKSSEIIESDGFLVFLETESHLARRIFSYLVTIAAKCSGLLSNNNKP